MFASPLLSLRVFQVLTFNPFDITRSAHTPERAHFGPTQHRSALTMRLPTSWLRVEIAQCAQRLSGVRTGVDAT